MRQGSVMEEVLISVVMSAGLVQAGTHLSRLGSQSLGQALVPRLVSVLLRLTHWESLTLTMTQLLMRCLLTHCIYYRCV